MGDKEAKSLRIASNLIQEVLGSLDIDFQPCQCCDGKKYANWNDFQSYQQLEGAITRIERCIRCAENKT